MQFPHSRYENPSAFLNPKEVTYVTRVCPMRKYFLGMDGFILESKGITDQSV